MKIKATVVCGLIIVLALLVGAVRVADAQTANLLSNGSFEDGANGWEYEQWVKPIPGVVDKQDHAPGYAASFKMGLAGATGARDFYHVVRGLKRAGESYLLTFWLKASNMPQGAAHVRLSRGYGGQIKSETGETDLAVSGGTHDWKQFKVAIRPQPYGAFGELVIHFLHDQMNKGTLGISGVALRVATPEELDRLTPEPAAGTLPSGPNLIDNGSFEEQMAGWGYEQWSNLPVPGIVDTQDYPKGCAASFKMGLAKKPFQDRGKPSEKPIPPAPLEMAASTRGDRWLAREIKLAQPGRSYLLTFWLKTEAMPGGAAYVRVGRAGAGWLGSEDGKSDVVKTGGTHDWRRFTLPIHAKELGECTKLTLFFYNDHMDRGTLGIAGVALRVATEEQLSRVRPPALDVDSFEEVLTGDTNHPEYSTFAVGEKVELKFHISGGDIHPKTPVTLALETLDEHDQRIDSRTIPAKVDADGEWETTVQAPARKLGFYRVKARLSDGTSLAALGTRPAGFLTYVVVPDPAKRVDYGDAHSRFAMQGPWSEDLCSLLGVRWVLDDSLQWGRTEPDHAGQFGPDRVKEFVSGPKPGGKSFRVNALPTLFKFTTWGTVPATAIYMTGTLTLDGEKAWAAYCKVAARAFIAKYATAKTRVYQITWEPIQPWGFKGTDAGLVRIYEIAYRAIHEADPGAIVAGPCRGLYSNGDPGDTERLLKAGLARYIDGYSVHAYHSTTPERDGMPQGIRTMKEILRSTCGKDIPMYGTEQGWPTDEDITKEVEQAQVLMRQNLITLGEGFQFNFAFTLYDYRMGGSRTGYGYYYNLIPGVPFGPAKMSPKAAASAYAAQSMLLEGTRSVGAVEWLGDHIWGYAFERSDNTILALWNYGSTPRDVSIPTGAKQVHVLDWMGNQRVADTVAGALTLKLGPEPIYVTGVSSKLWGSEAAKLLMVDARQLKAFPGGRVSVAGKAMMPADSPQPFRGSVMLEDPAGGLPSLSTPVSLGTSAPAPFHFDLDTLPTVRPGPHTLHLRLRNSAGETITATTLNLEVLSPLTVSTDVAFTAEGKPALAVLVEEKQGKSAAGRLDVRLKELIPGADRGDAPMIDLVVDPGKAKDVPGSIRQVAFDLPAKGRKSLLVDFPDASLAPARRYQSLVTATMAQNTTFSQTAPAHFLGAAHLTRPITIDGDLSEWQAMPPVVLSGAKDVVRSPQYYPSGLSATLRYAWDEHALYLAAEVDDDTFVQNRTGADIWSQDCLQLAFNLDAKPAGDVPHAGDRRTSEINVALTKNGPEAYRSVSYSAEKLPSVALTPAQLRLAVKKIEPGKLRYEMAIPWTTLGLPAGQTLKSGDAIGVAVTVNEVRAADQQDPCALGLFGGITDKNPDKHGILTLK